MKNSTAYQLSCKVLGLVFLIGIGAISQDLRAIDYDKALQGIVSNHTRALDRGNMYEKPLDAQDLNNWYGTIQIVGNFIADNSKKNKKQLMDLAKSNMKCNT